MTRGFASSGPGNILGEPSAGSLQATWLHSDTHPGGKLHVERKTISIMKACELVGVSRRTIYNWLSSGKIEYIRTAGGSVRIFVDTLWRDPNNTERPAVQAVWQAEGRNSA